MKTKPNKSERTRSKSARRNGKSGNDNNLLLTYEAELFWTQSNRATVRIKAKSREEAEGKTEEICSEDIDDWDPVSGEMFVDSVQLVAGGSDDE